MKLFLATILISLIPSTALAIEAFKTPDGAIIILGAQPNTTQILEYVNLNPKRRIRANQCGLMQVRESADFPNQNAVIKIGSETIQIDSLSTREKPRCRDGKLIQQPGDE